LFERYPAIEKAYKLSQKLKNIFEKNTNKDIARLKLAVVSKKVCLISQSIRSIFLLYVV